MTRLLMILLLFFSFFSCDENDILAHTATVQIAPEGLPTLNTGYAYQAWLLVNGTYVSIGTFNLDENGLIVENNGTSNDGVFENINNIDLANATGSAITIEALSGKSSPTHLTILAGGFSDSIALLTPDYQMGNIKTFYTEQPPAGTYILSVPTAKTNEGQYYNGLWFTQPTHVASSLTTLEDENEVTYQSWIVAPDDNNISDSINMGLFTSPSGVDDLNAYAGTSGNIYDYPGNDFVNTEGLNFAGSTLDLRGKQVIVTVQPIEYTSTTTPFHFILFNATIPASGREDVSYPLTVRNNFSATITR